MISKIHRALDPLDVEILERAFDETWAAFKEGETAIESDCDQALEAALHRELIEIARLYGVTESDTLRVALAGSAEPFLSMSASGSKLTLDESYPATAPDLFRRRQHGHGHRVRHLTLSLQCHMQPLLRWQAEIADVLYRIRVQHGEAPGGTSPELLRFRERNQ